MMLYGEFFPYRMKVMAADKTYTFKTIDFSTKINQMKLQAATNNDLNWNMEDKDDRLEEFKNFQNNPDKAKARFYSKWANFTKP